MLARGYRGDEPRAQLPMLTNRCRPEPIRLREKFANPASGSRKVATIRELEPELKLLQELPRRPLQAHGPLRPEPLTVQARLPAWILPPQAFRALLPGLWALRKRPERGSPRPESLQLAKD